MKFGSHIDESLESWDSLRREIEFSGLLLGNGASRAVWEGFAYQSLYEIAKSAEQVAHLTGPDVALFEELETRNFEQVLGALATADRVGRALQLQASEILQRYESIQAALAEAVRSKHVPWTSVPDKTLETLRLALLKYRRVYSTNYDLLVYWTVMHENSGGFKDLFWGEYFDIGNTEVWDKATVVLYIHGGLHLYRTDRGQTIKRRAQGNETLLDLFGKPLSVPATPLFVSEGTAGQKLESIYRSDYLAFAYAELARHDGPLCVFGHGLAETDDHIVSALRRAQVRYVGVSVRPGEATQVKKRKAEILSKLPDLNVRFYDSTTHPLGKADLKIDAPTKG